MAKHCAHSFKGIVSLVALACAWYLMAASADAAKKDDEGKVSHTPKQPKSGEMVTVTINVRRPVQAGDLLLQYQVVEPGQYIALADPTYSKNWEQTALEEVATKGSPDDAIASLAAKLPPELQKNRRVIRYRVFSRETESVIAPAAEDTQRNFAYFVYDGVPAWRGAINPKGQGKETEVVTFGPEVMRSIPAYHLISNRQSVENVTWRERMGLGHPDRHEYKYTGTLVVDGKVYDHIRFRARGGAWRHAMGKNMWKIDFNKGHNLEARDDYQRKYKTKWGKLNLGACIQQGDYGMRGEHGLMEAATFRLFNLAGVEAPHTHWVQLRIVDHAEESPRDQYRGDFWGLYLATEEIDDDFLEEHGLPDGNIYKMEFGDAKPEHIAKDAPTDRSDIAQFLQGLSRNPDAQWWRSQVDLPRYYGYRAIVECVHHYDIGGGKNYFYYHNAKAKRWQTVPWDVDLIWGDQMYGNGAEPFYRAGLLRADPFKTEYEECLADIRDLLFNPEQCGALLDEYAAVISAPKGGLSMVDADRAKWDYHPIMSSEWSVRGKADPGLFYKKAPSGDFRGMVQWLKWYADDRGKWVEANLLREAAFPARPKIGPVGKLEPAALKQVMQVAGAPKDCKVRWRLAEINSPNRQPVGERRPGKYEINALWESTGGISAEIPTGKLEKGRTYRIRAKTLDASGRWSRWSTPIEFTKPG